MPDSGQAANSERKIIPIDREKLSTALNGRPEGDLGAIVGLKAQTFLARTRNERLFTQTEINKIADHLGVSESAFTKIAPQGSAAARQKSHNAASQPKLPLSDSKDILQKYDSFGSNDFATIISADGFLEAHDEGFYDHIKRAIQRGLEVFYIIPQTIAASRSLEDYNKTLRKKFKNDLSIVEQRRVHCYHLDPDAELVGLSSRVIIFGKKIETEVVSEQIYVYVSSGHQYWVEFHEDRRHTFLTKLEHSIDPVPCNPPGVDDATWRLPILIKNRYQTGFTGREMGYDRVREILDTGSSAEEVARLALSHLAECEFPWEHRALRWLDIGCEDGTNTEIIYDILSSNNERQLSLTAIDSSAHQNPQDVLLRSIYWCGVNGTFERYIENHPASEKYDLITLLHSAYVIDPLCIVEAYRRLTDDGILILVSSPYKAGVTPLGETTGGNFINAICGVADNLLGHPRAGRGVQTPYECKTISDDPWRNYGEDWVAAFNKLFGPMGICWSFSLRQSRVSSDIIVEETKLTDDGELVANFFAHGRIDNKQIYLRDVYNTITSLSVPGHLPADEYFLYLSKRELRDNHPNPPRFRPNPKKSTSPDGGVSAQSAARPSRPLIVFVSEFGTCRDPMAKVIFERECADANLNVDIAAASTRADSVPVADGARNVIKKEFGNDVLRGHMSKPLADSDFEFASLIVVMEKEQKVSLERYQRYRGKVRLITDFDQELGFIEIANPYTPDEDNLSEKEVQLRYQKSFDQLQLALCDGMVAIVEAAKVAHRAL